MFAHISLFSGLFALNILAGIHFLKKYALYFPPVLSYMLHYIIYVGINIKGRPVFIDGGWCGVEQLKKTPSFSEKCEKNWAFCYPCPILMLNKFSHRYLPPKIFMHNLKWKKKISRLRKLPNLHPSLKT